jgi:hypothetical protein
MTPKFLSGCVAAGLGLLAGGAALGADWPARHSPGIGEERGILTCASRDGRYVICDLPRGFGEVRLVHQRSSRGCVENRTWGAGRSGIWVDRGCRGEFTFTYPVGRSIHGGYGWGDRDWDRRDDDWRYGRRDRDWGRGDERWNDRRGNNGRGHGPRARGRPAVEIGTLNCSSRDNRYRLCRIGTQFDRVQIERRSSNSACVRGRDWGTTRSGIWVDNGCRARFSFAYDARSRSRYHYGG